MPSYPNPGPRTLSDSHRRILFDESGISPDVVAERGTFTARRGADVPQDHGKLPKKPGMVLPVHTLAGWIFYRLRLDNPGRLSKYMQPKGHANRLDVHPRQHERIRQPGGMRYVTEGERKVDSGVSHDMLMIGQSGVFNGQRDKGAALIDDWDLLPIEGERYSITYDSDIMENPNIQLAADRLARLLRERGAEVFITLLPPAADGSKQGLDDFFANGGTAKELELLTRPYESVDIGSVRLSRNEKLRSAMEDLERRFWAFEWEGMGGHSARDVALKLIEAARRHGKVHPDGLRVVQAQGPLACESKVSSRTLWKSLNRLEEIGFGYRDNKGRKSDKAGAFVLRASVSQYGEKRGPKVNADPGRREGVPGDLHLRAPRLMWSRPKFTPKRGLIRGTRRVRDSKPPEPRARIERLGKIRGAILDALDDAGGAATLQEIADVLHRKRARDLRRRNLPMLEDFGIVTVEGDLVTLAADWLDKLREAREIGREIEAEGLARKRYENKSRAYHDRAKPPVSKPSAAGLEAVRRSREKAREHHRENLVGWVEEKTAPLSPLAVAVRDYLDRRPHDARQSPGWIGSTLWAFDLYPGKPTPVETRAAIEELGGAKYLDGRLKRAKGAA